MKLFLINLIPIITFSLSLMVYHRKTKKDILKLSVLCNTMSLIQYLLLNALSGASVKLMAISRDTYVVYKSKNEKKSLLIFIFLYIIMGFTTYTGIISLFPILSALLYTIFLWQNDPQKIRKVSAFTYIFWVIYNFIVKSYTGAFFNIISMISVIIAIRKNSKQEDMQI